MRLKSERYFKARTSALKYLLYKKRTCKEVANKLKSLEYEDELIDIIISDLLEDEYLDDNKYTEKFIEKNSNLSTSMLELKLANKGIPKDSIRKYILTSNHDDEKAIMVLLHKKAYLKAANKLQKDKIKAYIARKGFAPSLINKVIRSEFSEH